MVELEEAIDMHTTWHKLISEKRLLVVAIGFSFYIVDSSSQPPSRRQLLHSIL